MKYKNILFDLDGVISDNSEGITNGVRRVINHFCLREQTHEELLRFIGPPLIDSFCNYLGLSKAEAELGVRIYREYYKDRGIFENVMYAGIPEMLERLKRSKLQLYLATSKPEKFARRICERFGIAKYFTYIGGATLDGNRTKKSDVIRYVLECQKITASESIMAATDTTMSKVPQNALFRVSVCCTASEAVKSSQKPVATFSPKHRLNSVNVFFQVLAIGITKLCGSTFESTL